MLLTPASLRIKMNCDSWERMRCSPRSLPGFSGSLREISGSLPRFSDSLPQSLLSLWGFFRKPTSPPLPLREGPPLISVFSPQGRRGNRSSSSLVTISFYGWRTIRGLRQQRSCGFLCGDEPAFTQGLGYGQLAPCCSCWLLARCLLTVCPMLAGCSKLDCC